MLYLPELDLLWCWLQSSMVHLLCVLLRSCWLYLSIALEHGSHTAGRRSDAVKGLQRAADIPSFLGFRSFFMPSFIVCCSYPLISSTFLGMFPSIYIYRGSVVLSTCNKIAVSEFSEKIHRMSVDEL